MIGQCGAIITSRWQIAQAQDDDEADPKDPETDSSRVQREEWLVVVGICMDVGCIAK